MPKLEVVELSKPNKIPNDVVNIDELPAYSYK